MTLIISLILNIFNIVFLKINLRIASKKFTRQNIIKIAITGSYGKTSVKEILKTILQEKYVVLSTPKSYNTPVGLLLTIKNNNLSNYDVFIMEMGAKKRGEIKSLCKYFKPDYGILTAIGKQHLESFKNIDNIIKTKSELIEYCDYLVLNNDNKYVRNIDCNKNSCRISVGEVADIIAKNLQLKYDSSNFDVYLNDEFYCSCNTQLAGFHNVINILLAIAMAIKLGLTKQQIINGVKNLKPIKSRMEKISLNNGVIVINNGYNSNPDSLDASLKLLRLYGDKYKVVITPGFVEMGDEQSNLNFELGQKIAQVANECIVVNKVNRESIVNGLKSKNFKDYKLADKFKDIDFSIFSSNSVILIENDLPDNYV